MSDHIHGTGVTGCPEIDLDLDAMTARILLNGEIDIDVRPCFEQIKQQLHAFTGEVLVDSREVTFIDSSGIMTLSELAQLHPDRVTVLNASPTMTYMLEATTLINTIQLDASPIEAVQMESFAAEQTQLRTAQ